MVWYLIRHVLVQCVYSSCLLFNSYIRIVYGSFGGVLEKMFFLHSAVGVFLFWLIVCLGFVDIICVSISEQWNRLLNRNCGPKGTILSAFNCWNRHASFGGIFLMLISGIWINFLFVVVEFGQVESYRIKDILICF